MVIITHILLSLPMWGSFASSEDYKKYLYLANYVAENLCFVKEISIINKILRHISPRFIWGNIHKTLSHKHTDIQQAHKNILNQILEKAYLICIYLSVYP